MGSSYRDLIAWQKAMDFVTEVYRVSRNFPQEELYGLTSQLRRCSVSVPSNIAEGQGRLSPNDFKHFISMALGSLMESETQVLIGYRLSYISQGDCEDLLERTREIGRLLNGLAKSDLRYRNRSADQ
jgi:four helix bundle protein